MKILMVAPVPFFVDRGTPMRILEESLALEKEGVEVDIVTYHLGRGPEEMQNSKIKIFRVARLLFWYKKKEAGPNWQKIILDILLIWKTAKVVFLKKPEIIHAHLHEGVLIGWVVKYLFFWRKISLVADFHGELVSEMESHGYLNSSFIRKIFYFLEKTIFNLGDYAITSSGELEQKVRKMRQGESVEVVLDGVNVERYKSLGDISKEMDGVMRVIYSGAFVTNKGIDILLEAILKIHKKDIRDIKFILAGSPIGNIQDFISTNNLNEIVEIISPLNYIDVPRVNRMGDVAIDPKTSGVGQASGKILQYMGAGLPVICFDRENNRSYLGEAGYYVKDFSANGLVEAILYFLDNRAEIEKMSKISLVQTNNFTWQISAKKIISIYKKLKTNE